MDTVGFLGGGRVTRILLGGWQHAGALPHDLLVHDPDEAARRAAQAIAPALRSVTLEDAASAEVVFLALHPPAIPPVLPLIRPLLKRDALIVSLAPKVTLETLSSSTGTSRVARMIPNAPSIIGQGYNPVAFGRGIDPRARARLTALFTPWGIAPEVDESDLEAYAILTGMGPTYFWFQWQTLRELSADMRLPSGAVDPALRAMVIGALATLLDSGLSPAAVVDLVPVKPLAASEPGIVAAFREALPALHAKIRSTPIPAH
jgi:pyrroline-5-carboxylate reductase